MRLTLPQPHEDLSHTADAGVRVRGATAEEALARLALALGSLLAGGGPVAGEREERIAVAGEDLTGVAVTLLRELLFRFATERLIPGAVEVLRLDASGAEVAVGFGRFDPALHGEGLDVKAITWHLARLAPEGGGGAAGANRWVGQVVVDI